MNSWSVLRVIHRRHAAASFFAFWAQTTRSLSRSFIWKLKNAVCKPDAGPSPSGEEAQSLKASLFFCFGVFLWSGIYWFQRLQVLQTASLNSEAIRPSGWCWDFVLPSPQTVDGRRDDLHSQRLKRTHPSVFICASRELSVGISLSDVGFLATLVPNNFRLRVCYRCV